MRPLRTNAFLVSFKTSALMASTQFKIQSKAGLHVMTAGHAYLLLHTLSGPTTINLTE